MIKFLFDWVWITLLLGLVSCGIYVGNIYPYVVLTGCLLLITGTIAAARHYDIT